MQKRILVNFESSLLLTIVYKCTEHLQLFTNRLTLKKTFLQAAKFLKTRMYRHRVIKNAKLIKAWIKLKLFIVLDLITNIFCVSFPFSLTLYDTTFQIWNIGLDRKR